MDDLFSYFFRKTGSDNSCKLSVYMKCKNLFCGETKKNVAVCLLLNFFPSMLSVNLTPSSIINPENAVLGKQSRIVSSSGDFKTHIRTEQS